MTGDQNPSAAAFLQCVRGFWRFAGVRHRHSRAELRNRLSLLEEICFKQAQVRVLRSRTHTGSGLSMAVVARRVWEQDSPSLGMFRAFDLALGCHSVANQSFSGSLQALPRTPCAGWNCRLLGRPSGGGGMERDGCTAKGHAGCQVSGRISLGHSWSMPQSLAPMTRQLFSLPNVIKQARPEALNAAPEPKLCCSCPETPIALNQGIDLKLY